MLYKTKLKAEKPGKKEFWDGMYPQRILIQTPPTLDRVFSI